MSTPEETPTEVYHHCEYCKIMVSESEVNHATVNGIPVITCPRCGDVFDSIKPEASSTRIEARSTHGGVREGSGRPRKFENPAHITTYVSEEMETAIKRYARDNKQSKSEAIRELIQKGLQS